MAILLETTERIIIKFHLNMENIYLNKTVHVVHEYHGTRTSALNVKCRFCRKLLYQPVGRISFLFGIQQPTKSHRATIDSASNVS
jgi:hypothetical protein